MSVKRTVNNNILAKIVEKAEVTRGKNDNKEESVRLESGLLVTAKIAEEFKELTTVHKARVIATYEGSELKIGDFIYISARNGYDFIDTEDEKECIIVNMDKVLLIESV